MGSKKVAAIPPDVLARLGKVSDRSLAKQTGISVYFLKNAREARGIPPAKPAALWDVANDCLLGKKQDVELAKELGIPTKILGDRRRALGIPKYGLIAAKCEPEFQRLPAEVIKQLGRASDRELARLTGVSVYRLKLAREGLGIDAYLGPATKGIKPKSGSQRCTLKAASDGVERRAPIAKPTATNRANRKRSEPWKPEWDALLGMKSDREIALQVGRRVAEVIGRRRELNIVAFCSAWPPERVRLLGTMPDAELAKKLQLSVSTIGKRRVAMGIPLYPTKKTWQPEWDALLGTMGDADLAAKLQLCTSRVAGHRRALGIPIYRPEKAWKPEWDALLGMKSDREIALQVGRRVAEVIKRRRELNIVAFCNAWPPDRVRLLGTLPDAELAKKLQLSVWTVAKQRRALGISVHRYEKAWKPEWDALLGTRPDQEIAEHVRQRLSDVQARRRELRISAYSSTWPPERVRLLGTMPDDDLAVALGDVTWKAVRAKRHKLGIPASKRPRTPKGQTLPKWCTEAIINKLGVLSDYKLAEEIGIDRSCVTRVRHQLGIASKVRRVAPMDALLGTAPDNELAATLQLSAQTISNRRKALGIARYQPKTRKGVPAKTRKGVPAPRTHR